MNRMNEPYGWLEHSETLDEIKEEPFDDIIHIKQEDLIDYASDDIEDETKEIKEEVFEDFADVKQEEPILEGFNAMENAFMEIKEEPIDNFVNIKEEEFSTLPIADVFCPSTGGSRPLTIDFEKGIYSISQIASHPMMSANLMQMMQSECYSMLLKECAFCGQSHNMGTEMENHVRLMHPEELAKFRFLANMDNQSRSMRPGRFEESRQREVNSPVDSRGDGRSSKDEQLAAANGLPISAAEIADLPLSELKKLLKFDSLTETQRELIMKIRRRGKNRVANRKSYASAVLRLGLCGLKRPQKKCDFCDAVHDKGTEMDNHLRSMHPDILERLNSAVASIRDGRHNNDEELAVFNNLPISAAEIVDMPLSELKQRVKFDSLSESQRELIMKIRRRGQSRVANRKSYVSAVLRLGLCGPKSPHKERPSTDEQLAVDNNLPFSAAEIGEMSLSDFQQLLNTDSLTESQYELIKQIRKREKMKFVRQRAESQRELIARIEEREEEELVVCHSSHH